MVIRSNAKTAEYLKLLGAGKNMANKRLNDTKAVAGMKVVPNTAESINIEIRPIENGYIKRETKCNDAGGYTSKETFHSEKPSMDPMSKGGSNMMKDAVDFIKK